MYNNLRNVYSSRTIFSGTIITGNTWSSYQVRLKYYYIIFLYDILKRIILLCDIFITAFMINNALMLIHLCRVGLYAMYPWQSETNMHLPGGAVSVAHQFLRCVLHQLAPNGVFMQMFQTHLNGKDQMPI